MSNENAIKIFEQKQVRTHWDEEQEKWYFSIVDVIAVLTDSLNPRDYWFKMKIRVKTEDGLQLSTICRQLKMKASDGKMRETDTADTETLLRIVQSIPSPKAEPFKQWLAKVGYERMQEIADIMNKREFKDKVYGELSKVAKAMANPVRLEIIDLLAQGPFSVEQIATYIGQSVANASQHLQTLKNARLVQISRNGNFIYYALAGQRVFDAWSGLRELGMAYNAEVDKVIQDFRKGYKSDMDAVDIDKLASLIEKDEIILLDVRPEAEYNRGHIHHAMSAPIEKLEDFLKKLPKKKTVVAYCRGPFCVYADEAVAILQKEGYNAVRMDEGYSEWMRKGYPVESEVVK